MAESLDLPLNIVSRSDVNRLERELLDLEQFLVSAELREAGSQPKMPRTSRLFEEFLQANKLNALLEEDRSRTKAYLAALKKQAPVLHMSFSSDPSPVFTQKLLAWLRREIHPYLMLSIGLQPTLGAGCIVRTPNKYFDLSLRQRFLENRELLIEKLKTPVAEQQEQV